MFGLRDHFIDLRFSSFDDQEVSEESKLFIRRDTREASSWRDAVIRQNA
jgi:hypothetical protein